MILLLSLGTSNAELSQVGWSMEWLYTFPVPPRGLLLAKLGDDRFGALDEDRPRSGRIRPRPQSAGQVTVGVDPQRRAPKSTRA